MKKKAVKRKVGKLPPRTKEDNPSKPVPRGKYIRVGTNEPASRFVELGEMVHNKEVKWSYYSSDGNTGYHYYLILKDNKK